MRRYRNSAGSPTRIDYGIGLLAGLRAFPEIAPLAPSFEQTNADLEAALQARQALRNPMVHARARMRFAHYHARQAIRMVENAAQNADGGRRGPLTGALLPDGLKPVVAPKGAALIKPAEDLLDRMTKCKLAQAAAFRAEWTPTLEVPLEALRQASAAYDSAKTAYVNAFAEELSQRAEHARQVDRLMGLVRAAFPRDRAKQDVVFPEPFIKDSDLPSEDEEGEATAPASTA